MAIPERRAAGPVPLTDAGPLSVYDDAPHRFFAVAERQPPEG